MVNCLWLNFVVYVIVEMFTDLYRVGVGKLWCVDLWFAQYGVGIDRELTFRVIGAVVGLLLVDVLTEHKLWLYQT